MKHFYSLSSALFGALLLSLNTALAEVQPEDQIKYRQHTMKALGAHMGSLALLARGKVDHPGHVARHAEALAAVASDLAAVFPEGLDFGETRARDSIWEEWERFEQLSRDLATAASGLARAGAGDPAALRRALGEVGEACKACHERYRSKPD